MWYNTKITFVFTTMPSRVQLLVGIHGLLFCMGIHLVSAQAPSPPTVAQYHIYVTRAEAAAFLLRDRNPPIPNIRNNGTYPDVLEEEWYTRYVMAALAMGMWNPDIGTNRAHPHQIVSRGEYLQMMSVAFDLRTGGPYAYKDVHQNHQYKDVAGMAAKYKLFFDPADPLRLRTDLPVSHEDASKAYYALLANKKDLQSERRFALYITQASETPLQKNEDTPTALQTYMTAVSRALVKGSLQRKLQNTLSVADRIQQEIIAATNVQRAAAGVPPVVMNKNLQAAAIKHAKDMYERGYFSHFTPEGLSYVDRIKISGYTDVDPVACHCQQVFNVEEGEAQKKEVGANYIVYEADVCSCTPKIALGENLAKGQLTVEEVVEDWMNSPGHRRNILEPSFTELGVGIFRDLWVQNFGKFEVSY